MIFYLQSSQLLAKAPRSVRMEKLAVTDGTVSQDVVALMTSVNLDTGAPNVGAEAIISQTAVQTDKLKENLDKIASVPTS